MHLDRSGVPPTTDEPLDMEIPEFVSDVILLQGRVKSFHNKKEVYTAPMLLPRNCVRIINVSLILIIHQRIRLVLLIVQLNYYGFFRMKKELFHPSF